METIQETSEVLIFANINGGIAQFVSNGGSVAINSAWLQLLLLKHGFVWRAGPRRPDKQLSIG